MPTRPAVAPPAGDAKVIAHPTIALLRSASLASAAQQEIARMILSGQLAPGAKLAEARLSEQLGVSRGPIREAFRRLEEAGLVRQEKNRGVFVRLVPLEEANEIYEVRAALEGLIGRLAARRIDAAQIEQLRSVVKKMYALDRTRKAETYFALNVEFHDLLARAAGNSALLANYRRVVNELDLYRRETIARGTENIPGSTREHEAIVNAVAKGDEKLAERLMFDHVIQSRQRLHAALARQAAGERRAG
ncbi:MAG: FCD domain-containing protein [Gemmatimonadota bacterium]